MIWKFFINDTEIEEPVGFAEFVITIKRDEVWKGIFFEASASSLQFYGDAFDLLKSLKETQGLKATAIFSAEVQCEDETTFEEAIRGKLNFGQYKETCGDECFISLPVEQDNCTMIIRNRYDQKVNIDDDKSFNRDTALPAYDGINKEFVLPTVSLPVLIDASVAAESYEINQPIVSGFVSAHFAFRPLYAIVRDNSIAGSNIDTGVDSAATPPNNAFGEAISPQLLFENITGCFSGDVDYTFRLKGSFNMHDAGLITVADPAKIILIKGIWPAEAGTVYLHSQLITVTPIPGGDYTANFDVTFTGSTTLIDGQGLYMLLQWEAQGSAAGAEGNIQVIFAPESSVVIDSTKECPPTNARATLVHELAARICESITDLCVTVKSEYYGRIDSEPYAFAVDGCGGLRILTNGLKLRQADKNNEFFISLKELFEGLNAIDNIGIGIEEDATALGTDKRIMRIEDARYFFQNIEVMRCDGVPKAVRAIMEQNIFAKIIIGYDKYESEAIKGAGEYNAEREFHTGINATDTTLAQSSKFIAGTYPIEVTAAQQFASSGEADTTYDNETFIICMARIAYGLIVEQGNIDSAVNVPSPATMLNWRIRPFYNLMRWAKSILQSYANIYDIDSKIFFSSGKGNYTAAGELPAGDVCKLEKRVNAENNDLEIFDFENESDGMPILKAENITFEYPLSIAEYRAIKKTPYGYISVQCGNGDFFKAFIQQIDYRVTEGIATFNLVLSQMASVVPPEPVPTIREFNNEFSDEFN